MNLNLSESPKRPAYVWENIIFFAVTALVTLIGAPIYIHKFGISTPEIILFAFYMVATGLGITVGYHRLFAHVNYKASPIVRFLLLFFGAAAFEQSVLKWASQHRDHHQYVDTDRDPYSIKKGFFYAHIGWMIFWEHQYNFDNVKDLQKSPMIMHQHKYYMLWSIVAGILTPIAIGALTGHALGAFIFAVCTRLTLVYHATFCINSVCHMFGKATYDIYATAKDHWFVALMTYGEGYHNFHHRFPSDYRNGVRWYQWDPSKWVIAFLSRVGLTHDLRTVSRFQILHARLAAEHQRTRDLLETVKPHHSLKPAFEAFRQRYENLRHSLVTWERAAAEYQKLIRVEWDKRSHDFHEMAHQKMKDARAQFEIAHRQWDNLISQHPIDLQKYLLLAAGR